jgi:rhodanese-related sulfurtransferase/polyisoprenoid-binding protein YceI
MNEKAGVLIDILSGDSYEREHLPGAVNFCVYETAFVSKIKEAFPDKGTHLAICGYCSSSKESDIALEKLRDAGYKNVTVVEGGLKGWIDEGGKTVGHRSGTGISDGRQVVDEEGSFIRWTGRNLFNFHTGDLKLKGGTVEWREGRLVSAEATIDMESIACSDLTDSTLNRMLIDHLRTDDFFDVGNHPEARIRIASAEKMIGVTAGLSNHRMKGELSLRGKSHPLEFDALVAWKDDGTCVLQTVMDFDRTLWGSIYGSGKFFSRLGQHVVNDLIHLHVKVATKR